MFEALELELFQRALIAGLLASVACGVVGTFVVVKRMASISGGLSHAAFGGVGLGYLLGFSPMLGGTAFALASALLIGFVYLRNDQNLDTLIAMVWAVGMALGMLFISMTPGYAPDLSSYLFGSILFVPEQYLWMAIVFDVLVCVVVARYFRQFQSVSFDQEFSVVAGVRVELMFLTLMTLTGLAVVLLIRVVGVILTIALLTTPAVIARHWCYSLVRMMVVATLVTALCTVLGLFLSYRFSVPSGPLIVLIVMGLFCVSALARTVGNSSVQKG